MAYTQLVDIQCTNAADFFQRFRDFVCKRNGTYDYSVTGIGWTLHDSVYAVNQNTLTANDYIVIYSPGESGREQMYFRISYLGTTQLAMLGYLYWNNTTHGGVISYESSLYAMGVAASPKLCVYGNLDSVAFLNGNAVSVAWRMFGKLQSFDSNIVSETIAFSTTDLSAGIDKSIVLDITLPSDWGVNKNLFIWDNAHIEQVSIKTINTSTKTITVNLVYAYTGVIKVSRFCGYWHIGTNNYIQLLISQLGTFSVSCSSTSSFIPSLVVLDGQKWMLTNFFVVTASGMEGKVRNIKNYSQTAPLAIKDILTDNTGVNWRCMYVQQYAGMSYVAYKEV